MTTPSAAAVIALAQTQVGVHEGHNSSGWNNDQKYSDETPGFDWSDGQPWCDTFVAWCSWKSGFSEDQWPRSASCDVSGSAFKSMGRWSEYPALGAQVFFGTHSDLQHTGIVTKYDDTYIWTVEGNTNSSGSYQGDGVYAKMHERRDSRLIGYGYPKFPEGITSADPKWQTKPTPVPGNKRRLKVGTFNLLRGRSPATVLHEVLELVDRHNIVALAVQEAEGYFDALSGLRDFDYFAAPDNPENGILVIEGRGSNFYTHEVGDGWVRDGGAKRGPGEFPRVTVDDWCRIGSTHWPPSTTWRDGQLVAPPERVDDVREWAAACQRFLSLDGTRALLGDNNERAKTRGEFSPGWVAEQTGAKVGSTGAIDWGMVVGGHFENVVESNSPEKSDHEPQVMDVVES